MDQARKDTSGVKLEVNERFVYFSDFKRHLVTRCLVSLILIKIKLVGTVFQIKKTQKVHDEKKPLDPYMHLSNPSFFNFFSESSIAVQT